MKVWVVLVPWPKIWEWGGQRESEEGSGSDLKPQ